MAKPPQDDGILLPVLYALLGGVGMFTLVSIIGITVTYLRGPSQVANLDTAPVQSQSAGVQQTTTPSQPRSTPTPAPAPEAAEPPEEETPEPEPQPEPQPTVSMPEADPQPEPETNPQSEPEPQAPTSTPTAKPAANPAQPAVTPNTSQIVTPPPSSSQPSSSNSGNSSSARSNGGNWGESSTTNEITGSLNQTAYWTQGGKSYHFSSNCVSLSRSKNIKSGTLQDALSAGKTDPCNICAGGS